MFPTPKNTAFSTYTFGSIMVSVSKGEYRYGMNTQEKDNEIYGEGNSYSAEYWQYDARLGRRWNVDPVVKVHESPYATFANNPIGFVDPSGADTAFSDNETRQLVLSYVDKNHKNYNENYAKKFQELVGDKNTVYKFNDSRIQYYNTDENVVLGTTPYLGQDDKGRDIVGVNFTSKPSSFYSNESILFEETFHAWQFMKGDWGFVKTLNDKGEEVWGSYALDIHDEKDAKVWMYETILKGERSLGTQHGYEYDLYQKKKEKGFLKYLSSRSMYKNLENEKRNVMQQIIFDNEDLGSSESDFRHHFNEEGVSKSSKWRMRLPH
jgi:RHS repeat-associated protein